MRPLLSLSIALLIACGGKSSPPPASTAKPAAPAKQAEALPYIHDCGETGKRCALDECVAYKVAHKEQEQMATDECMQDCNCGE